MQIEIYKKNDTTTRNYSMTFREKYIHLLFLVGLSLHSLPVMSAEFMYGDAPVQEVTETTKAFSEIISENPIFLAVPATAVVTGLLFRMRDPIHKKYLETLDEVKNKKALVEDNLPVPVKAVVNMGKWAFLCGYRPIAGGAGTYVKHNWLHMMLSTASLAGGYALAYQMTGAFIAATISTVGYMRQGYYELKEEISESRKENKELHDKTHEKVAKVQNSIEEINQKTNKLIVQMASTGQKIVGEIDKLNSIVESKHSQVVRRIEELQVVVEKKVETVGVELKQLNHELKDVPQNILNLKQELNSIVEQNKETFELNNTLIKQTQKLQQDINKATDAFVSTQKKFDELGVKFTQKLKELNQNIEKLDQKIDHGFKSQKDDLKKFRDEIQSKTKEELSLLKGDMHKELQGLSGTVSILADVSKVIKVAQESRDGQIAQLISDSQEHKRVDMETQRTINKIMEAQAASAQTCSQMLSDLNSIRGSSYDIVAQIIPKINTVDERLANISEDITAMKAQLEKEKAKRKELKNVIYGMADTVSNLSVQNNQLLFKISNLEKITTETNTIAQRFVPKVDVLPESSPLCVPINSFEDMHQVFLPNRKKLQTPKIPDRSSLGGMPQLLTGLSRSSISKG